jgi:penicillin-binding protein 2
VAKNKMLVVDELKKNEPQLRFVAVMLAVGLGLLLAGLWWVQVVSAREYQSHLETQASRSIRLPAVRGKILDRAGRVLAENRPCYNLSLYLEDLGEAFQREYSRLRPVKIVTNPPPFWKFWSDTPSVVTSRARLKEGQISALTWQARYNVVSALAAQAGEKLGQPLTVNPAKFVRAYQTRLALPFPILENLNETQIARFEENHNGDLGADLELESVRYYPNGTLAGHLLGYLLEDDRSMEGEESSFNYRLPDYHGVVGIEYGYDASLRGRAGAESVLVNSRGFRQSENIWSQPEPGRNVVLTLDLDLQRAAEKSLAAHQGTNARAAVVIMDVRNGSVLAMVSSPALDPDYAANDPTRMADDKLRPAINRATQENFAPGSIFKPIVGLAALEAGLNPERDYTVDADPARPGRGCIYVGRRKIEDTAPPGDYRFKRAIERSSNSYFIQIGLQARIERIIALAEKFHLGERTGLPTRQETRGNLPSLTRISRGWTDGDTANVCIGQGEVAVTPLQMAVVYSAIANGGKVFWPQLVLRIEPQDPAARDAVTNFPSALLRDQIGVSGRSLRVLHDAMLAETEDAEGTGQAARVPGLRICGKTGTAQVQDSANRLTGYNFWFASFAPYESPRYAVVVMVQSESNHGSGGLICAPIAHDIYEEILQTETTSRALSVIK